MTSSTPTFETSYPVTVVCSGFTFGSCTVYYAQMTVSLSMVAGTQWWGFQRPCSDTWYVGVGSVVEGYEAYRTLGAGYFDEPSLSTYRAAWLRTEASIVMGDRIAADTFDGISQTDIYFCFSHNDMSTFPPA
jgi:hypothetical protein